MVDKRHYRLPPVRQSVHGLDAQPTTGTTATDYVGKLHHTGESGFLTFSSVTPAKACANFSSLHFLSFQLFRNCIADVTAATAAKKNHCRFSKRTACSKALCAAPGRAGVAEVVI